MGVGAGALLALVIQPGDVHSESCGTIFVIAIAPAIASWLRHLTP